MLRRQYGICGALLFIAFSSALTGAAAATVREGGSQTKGSSEFLSESDVLTAYRAWNKLRDEIKPGVVHGAHRREAVDVIEDKDIKVVVAADEGVGERHLLSGSSGSSGSKGQRERGPSLLTEYTVDAESSFTAVSHALDALANQTRLRNETGKGSAERSAIATNVFVIEGNIDKDSVKTYLNSKRASEALARSEANALRKVMALLLQPESTNQDGGSVIHTRIGRSVANPTAKEEERIKRSVRRVASPNHLLGHRQRHDPGKMKNRINTKGSRWAPKSVLRRKSNYYLDVQPRVKRRVRKARPGAQDDDDDDDDEEEEETPKFMGKYKPNKGSFYRKPPDEEEEEEDNPKGKAAPPKRNSTANEEPVPGPRRRTNQHWRDIDSFAARSGLRFAYEDAPKKNARYIGYGAEKDPHGFAKEAHASDRGNNTSSVEDDP